MSYSSYLPKDVVESWRLDDLAWMRENREQRKTFVELHNKAIKNGNYEQEKLSQEIIKELDNEYRKLSTDTQITSEHIRYVDGATEPAGGWPGHADKMLANVKPEDNGVESRKDVRYRWQDESGQDHVGDAAGDGPSEARP